MSYSEYHILTIVLRMAYSEWHVLSVVLSMPCSGCAIMLGVFITNVLSVIYRMLSSRCCIARSYSAYHFLIAVSWIQYPQCHILNAAFWMMYAGCRILNCIPRILNSERHVPSVTSLIVYSESHLRDPFAVRVVETLDVKCGISNSECGTRYPICFLPNAVSILRFGPPFMFAVHRMSNDVCCRTYSVFAMSHTTRRISNGKSWMPDVKFHVLCSNCMCQIWNPGF